MTRVLGGQDSNRGGWGGPLLARNQNAIVDTRVLLVWQAKATFPHHPTNQMFRTSRLLEDKRIRIADAPKLPL